MLEAYFATKSALSWSMRVPLQLGLSHCRTANSSRKKTSPAGSAFSIAVAELVTPLRLRRRLSVLGGRCRGLCCA